MDPNLEQGGTPAPQSQAPAPTGDAPAAQAPQGEVPVTPATPTETPATPTETPVAQAPQSETPAFTVPDEFKDKSWAKGLENVDDLFKRMAAADEFVGKKSMPIDFAKATPQEIEEHYKASRPESEGDYAFGEGVDPAEKEFVSKLMHDNGISKHQADALISSYAEMTDGLKAEHFSEEGFLDNAKSRYGDVEHKNMIAQGEKTVRAHLNEADRKTMDSLPNSAVDVIYAIANNMTKAYGASESGIQGDNPAPTGGAKVDVTAERSAIRKEMHALGGKPHTAEQKQALQDRLNATY